MIQEHRIPITREQMKATGPAFTYELVCDNCQILLRDKNGKGYRSYITVPITVPGLHDRAVCSTLRTFCPICYYNGAAENIIRWSDMDGYYTPIMRDISDELIISLPIRKKKPKNYNLYLHLLEDEWGAYGIEVTSRKEPQPVKYILRPDKVQQVPEEEYHKIYHLCYPRHESNYARSAEWLIIDGLWDTYCKKMGLQSHIWQRFTSASHFYAAAKRHRNWVNKQAAIMLKMVRQSADQEAMKIARRYHKSQRGRIYYHCVKSARAKQLCQTFPALAAEIYAVHPGSLLKVQQSADISRIRNDILSNHGIEHIAHARRMVEEGRPLKVIAAFMHIPMGIRSLRPQLTHAQCLVKAAAVLGNRFTQHIPPKTLDQHRVHWIIRELWVFKDEVPIDFIVWSIMHQHELPKPCRDATAEIQNLLDWARAPQHRLFGAEPFNFKHSLKGAVRRNNAWHEAVIQHQHPNSKEPLGACWIAPATVNGFYIAHLNTRLDLGMEGKAMHHCVGGYADDVEEGRCNIYSVRDKEGSRMATLELRKTNFYDGGYTLNIRQIKAHMNNEPTEQVRKAVETWVAQYNRDPKLGNLAAKLYMDSNDYPNFELSQVETFKAQEHQQAVIEVLNDIEYPF